MKRSEESGRELPHGEGVRTWAVRLMAKIRAQWVPKVLGRRFWRQGGLEGCGLEKPRAIHLAFCVYSNRRILVVAYKESTVAVEYR
jgi:hypothetical protein